MQQVITAAVPHCRISKHPCSFYAVPSLPSCARPIQEWHMNDIIHFSATQADATLIPDATETAAVHLIHGSQPAPMCKHASSWCACLHMVLRMTTGHECQYVIGLICNLPRHQTQSLRAIASAAHRGWGTAISMCSAMLPAFHAFLAHPSAASERTMQGGGLAKPFRE